LRLAALKLAAKDVPYGLYENLDYHLPDEVI
jgi:hypothetical protein